MNIAVSYHPGQEQATPAAARSAGAVARVDIYLDMPAAEPAWRHLEDGRPFATPYQRFDLLAAWQRHVGARTGVTPFIVTGFDHAGEPLFLWPFGRARTGPLELISFLGSKHANFNVGVWRRDSVAAIGARELRDILARVADHGVDLIALFNQPLSWDGVANPFALLPHQPAVDMSAHLTFARGEEDALNGALTASMRSRLRGKERKLQKLDGYCYLQPTSSADIDRLLADFFALKSSHMAAQGLNNAFAEEGAAEFLREACHGKFPDGRPLIEIHALEGGGELLALFGATADDYRFSSMFNTYTLGENGRHSPGLVLLAHMVRDSAKRGSRSFDLGVGRAEYKSYFCREPQPLFDSFLPLSVCGRLAALVFGTTFAARRVIKQNPTLWSAVQTLRRVRARG
jgi:CelD/BcsL family acetyltransferase involved in cellulose biosynthesis